MQFMDHRETQKQIKSVQATAWGSYLLSWDGTYSGISAIPPVLHTHHDILYIPCAYITHIRCLRLCIHCVSCIYGMHINRSYVYMAHTCVFSHERTYTIHMNDTHINTCTLSTVVSCYWAHSYSSVKYSHLYTHTKRLHPFPTGIECQQHGRSFKEHMWLKCSPWTASN